MSQTGTRPRSRRQLSLGGGQDGSPLLMGLAAVTLLVGVAVFVGGFVVRLHLLASVVGLAGLAVGLVLQMVSTTRAERILIVPGVIGAFVGMALGLAHGGF